jgi:hypothetical protein
MISGSVITWVLSGAPSVREVERGDSEEGDVEAEDAEDDALGIE